MRQRSRSSKLLIIKIWNRAATTPLLHNGSRAAVVPSRQRPSPQRRRCDRYEIRRAIIRDLSVTIRDLSVTSRDLSVTSRDLRVIIGDYP